MTDKKQNLDTALLDVCLKIAQARNFADLWSTFSDTITELTNAESIIYYDYNLKENTLVLRGSHDEKIGSFTLEKGAVGLVAEKGEYLVLNNPQGSAIFDPTIDNPYGLDLKNLMVVSVEDMHKNLLGVFSVLNIPDGIGTRDEYVGCTLSEYLAAAIVRMGEIEHEVDFNKSLLELFSSLVDMAFPGFTGHTGRVHDLVMKIGADLGLGPQAMRELSTVTYLHNIGKNLLGPDTYNYILGSPTSTEYMYFTTGAFQKLRFPPALKNSRLIEEQYLSCVAELIRDHYGNSEFEIKTMTTDEIRQAARVIFFADAYDQQALRGIRDKDVIAELAQYVKDAFDERIVELIKKHAVRIGPAEKTEGTKLAKPALVKLLYNNNLGPLEFHAEVETFSENGITFFSDKRLPLGAILKFEIMILDYPMKAIGRVMSVRDEQDRFLTSAHFVWTETKSKFNSEAY